MPNALPVLDEIDQRILGALLEKQRTVPASYPLSLNSLRLACNQTTSRDPVVSYSEPQLEQRLQELKQRELVRIVWAGKGARTLKYHQRLAETLAWDDATAALMTVLLLRGAQSAGELKTRTERLHRFADRDEVEACLRTLAAAEPPQVRELERRAGQHDTRWIHLLGPVPGAEPEPARAAVDREVVLREGAAARDAAVVAAYDAVAGVAAADSEAAWAEAEFDAWLLARVAAWSRGWPVADIGCGFGHTSAFLAEAGAEVVGSDASPAMIAAAETRYPDLTWEVTPFARFMRPRTAAGWGAVVAWSCWGQLAASEVRTLLGQLAATLRIGGVLALRVDVGDEEARPARWLGHDLGVLETLHDPDQILAAAAEAGLTVFEHYRVGPASETQAERFYLLAHRDA